MSHKEKLCRPALASHIEVCHEQCNYTPLIISRRIWLPGPVEPGLPRLVESELAQKTGEQLEGMMAQTQNYLKNVRNKIQKVFDSNESKADEFGYDSNQLSLATLSALEKDAQHQLETLAASVRQKIVASEDGKYDLRNLENAVNVRMAPVREDLVKTMDRDLGQIEINQWQTYEMDGLGMFFKEAICYRSEGMTYSPCGEEFTILPGEKITEGNVLKTSVTSENSSEVTINESLTNKSNTDETDTFTKSYDKTLKKETDIKLSRESSFKVGVPFKKIKLDLSRKTTGSLNFNRIMTEVNKTSHTKTHKRFNEVVRELTVDRNSKSSLTESVSTENSFNRSWENKTDKPLTYIKRKSFCKTSVIHKRLNVQLAWSGCIDDPGKDLCTPDNLDDKLATEIQAIRQKWNNVAPPASFGPRPSPRKVCTSLYRAHNSALHIGQSVFNQAFQYTIPSGWSYEGNSASVDIGYHSSAIISSSVQSQPSGGATGGIQFQARVRLSNRYPKKEEVEFKVCFNILPAAAADWDDRVDEWREQQAQLEIDEFLQKEKEKLKEFLASDQARAAVERRIMEEYFGISNIQDCCKFMARLREVFDFDNMCYSLLPSWNENGEGCQRSFPVNLYTAKCLHFFVPIMEGAELDAIALLNSINAIPWSAQIAVQVLQYVQAITNMRDTLYNRLFDSTGWDVKFDRPYDYTLTPYNSSSSDWEADHESDLNYEVVGAFTINVPIGERIDCRPALCCEDQSSGS